VGNESVLGLWGNAVILLFLVGQASAAAILLSRLIGGLIRRPALSPEVSRLETLGQVSIIVPTLNEAERISPCLAGLSRQGYEVREVLVVDSRSQDGTPELVKAAQVRDRRFRLLTDDPLPLGWVGRPWALHSGFLQSSESSQWILGIDADTQPQPGLVASLLKAAEAQQLDLISLSPQFILKYPGEWWLQPALLVTLIYRFGAGGAVVSTPERVLANGQCFLIRRSLLAQLGGYSGAQGSFCDDVTLARQAAATGARVAFLDGANLLRVRMYEGMAETWREWGRSLDLKDATSPEQLWVDLGWLWAIQGLPLPLGLGGFFYHSISLPLNLLWGLNLGLVLLRVGVLSGIRTSYARDAGQGRWLFWLSPLADPLAVLRIFLSSLQRPKSWRGRVYG
jgi:dolichol-phosphate mannosyltransferase